MAHPPPSTSVVGWHPDPYSSKFLRYWDGARWTEHMAPKAGPPGAGSASGGARTGDWVGGILLAFLMSPIGLIAGIVYATKNDARRTVGFVTMGLSAAMMVLSLLVAFSGGPGGV